MTFASRQKTMFPWPRYHRHQLPFWRRSGGVSRIIGGDADDKRPSIIPGREWPLRVPHFPAKEDVPICRRSNSVPPWLTALGETSHDMTTTSKELVPSSVPDWSEASQLIGVAGSLVFITPACAGTYHETTLFGSGQGPLCMEKSKTPFRQS